MAEKSLLREVLKQTGGLPPDQTDAMKAQGLDPANPEHRQIFEKQKVFVNPESKTEEKAPATPYTTQPLKYKEKTG